MDMTKVPTLCNYLVDEVKHRVKAGSTVRRTRWALSKKMLLLFSAPQVQRYS